MNINKEVHQKSRRGRRPAMPYGQTRTHRRRQISRGSRTSIRASASAASKRCCGLTVIISTASAGVCLAQKQTSSAAAPEEAQNAPAEHLGRVHARVAIRDRWRVPHQPRVLMALDLLFAFRGVPRFARSRYAVTLPTAYNGPEFIMGFRRASRVNCAMGRLTSRSSVRSPRSRWA